MNAEMEVIENNETWELGKLPPGMKKIGVKWVYKNKLNEKGEVDKYKVWLVVKGYIQKYGIDYDEVFAPVARWDTIRIIPSLDAQKGWGVFQLYAKGTFLHGVLKENPPEGYVQKGEEYKV